MTSALMPTYARADLAFDRGEGCWLITAEGERYLDFTSGIAVAALGHAHPHLVQALGEQASKLWHTSNLFRIPAGERLADRFAAATFADSVFFCNSGVEAIEGGLKLVRKYHDETGNPQRWRVVTCGGAFHGRSLTTISAAGNAKYMAGFDPAVPGFDNVAFGNLNELRAAITDETAAILVEPVQGEGGIRPAALDYLRGLREVCDEYGLLLFFDEIQCGMGRTGKLFAHEWAGIAPDVMAVAKGIGGGFPLGAFMATREAAQGMTAGTHGSTYGGNPLGMAVGNAVLDIMLAEGFLAEVDRKARRLWGRLQDLTARHPSVFSEVRGAGLMLGLKCVPTNTEVVASLREARMLTVPAAENVIRLLPPLVMSDEEADLAVDTLDRVARRFAEAA